MECHKCGKDLSKTDHFNLAKSVLHIATEVDPVEYPFIRDGEPYFMEEGTPLLFCDVVCLWRWCESDGKFESILQLESGITPPIK